MSTRRADVFLDPAEDPREIGGRLGDERATYVEYLRTQRLTLEIKCAGLSAEQLAARSVPPSTMSLLGLVRHLAEVERSWFKRRLADQDIARRYQTAEDPDGDFTGAVADPAVVDEAFAAWKQEIAYAEQWLREHDDQDATIDLPSHGLISVREVLVHMVEEYARHNGHADFLRECLDGKVGQ